MSDQRQEFDNNFSNYESTRFNFGIAMLMTLFSKENQELINQKIREQLIEVKTVEDSQSPIKGMVYANETDDIEKSRIFYIKNEPNKSAYSWHMMIHELAHFIGKPDKETIESEITSNSDRSELGGTQIFDFNTNTEYGNFFNECGADLLCEMAMTTSVQCKATNPQIKSVDDIIYTNNRFQKTDYDSLSTIARLMMVAMDNNFSNQSYDRMVHSDEGLIDRQVQMINQKTGENFDVVPTNDYLYAMSGHGIHLEKQFDRFSREGNYREMCSFLDGEVKALQTGENHVMDKEQLKEQLLRIADMVNNKMYILQSNNCINQEQKDAFIGRFNLVFNQALIEYDIGALTQEDIEKTTVSMNLSKSQALNEQQIPSTNTRTNRYGSTINPNITEHLQPISDSKDSKLSLKQKIAQFLQKNSLFMNMSFVDRFVHNQLDVLPPAIQGEKEEKSTNSARETFMNLISNNGEYRNLPPIQRMADPQKIEEMKKKMEQHQQENNGGGR